MRAICTGTATDTAAGASFDVGQASAEAGVSNSADCNMPPWLAAGFDFNKFNSN